MSQLFHLSFFGWWHVLLAFYLVMSYLVVLKINRVLEAREGLFDEKINKASAYRKEAEELLAEYEATLA